MHYSDYYKQLHTHDRSLVVHFTIVYHLSENGISGFNNLFLSNLIGPFTTTMVEALFHHN